MAEIEIIATTDNSLLARLARLFGAKWTHVMLRFLVPFPYTMKVGKTYWMGEDGFYHIIEAGFRHGVIERSWNPKEYIDYLVLKLSDRFFDDAPHKKWACERMLAFARGEIGKRYAFESLGVIAMKMARLFFGKRAGRPDSNTLAMASLEDISGGLIGQGEVCSSLVDKTFLVGGFDLVIQEDSSLVLPDQIAESPLLEMVERQ